MLGAPSNASAIPSPEPSAVGAVKAPAGHPQPIPEAGIEAAKAAIARPDAITVPSMGDETGRAGSAVVPPIENEAPGAPAAPSAIQEEQAPSKEAGQAPDPESAPPGDKAAQLQAPAAASGIALSADASSEEPAQTGVPPAVAQDAQVSDKADGGAFPGASFEPDAGAIESLDSVHHAILNAAMMNKGMTSDGRDDINMALDSRWKDPGDPHAGASPEAELPDSMLPMLKEVLPYIDFIASKQEELEAAISERNSAEDAGAKLRALGESIRQTAEIGVSKGIAERDYVPTQITVNESAPDPDDPFAGGSDEALERAGGEPQEAGAAGAGAAGAAQDRVSCAQEPMRQPEDALAQGGEVPAPASAPAKASAPASVSTPLSQGSAASHDGAVSPASAGALPDASNGTASGAKAFASVGQPPLSAREIEEISRAASEDLSADQEDAAAPGPMMFGPGEGFVEGRRPGESVQDMLARAQKAAMAQLEAEDHGEAGLGAADAALDAPEQRGDAQGTSQGRPQAEPHEAEIAPASPEGSLPQQASLAGDAPVAQDQSEPSSAAEMASQGPAMSKPPVQEDAPVENHGLRLIADPFSDDMSESTVESARPYEDLASAEAEYAASAHPLAAKPEPVPGSDAAKSAGRAGAAMSASLKKALLDIEGGADASLDQPLSPANGEAPIVSPAAPAPSPFMPSPSSQAAIQGQAITPAVAPVTAQAVAPAPFEPPARDMDDGAAQGIEPPDFGQYVPPDDDSDDDDDVGEGFQEASQNEAAIAAFEDAQDSRVAQGGGDQAVAVTPEPLPDGDPASMPPAQRAELERIERIEAGQQVRPLIAQDFMPYVRKADPWLQDIEAAGYKDALYSALISSSRSIDPADSSHWILKMSERFSYFINDPSFSHNLETKFSFMRNGNPVRITIEQCDGLPQGCPLALASKALRDETQKARSRLSSFKPFTRILSLAGADFNNVPITLYGSAGSKAQGDAQGKGGSGS